MPYCPGLCWADLVGLNASPMRAGVGRGAGRGVTKPPLRRHKRRKRR